MAKKKTILFVNESLRCGGGEKSLLNLLEALDYDRYEVYLQLFDYGNPWDKLIDPRVNVLPHLDYCKFTGLPLKQSVIYALKHFKFKYLFSRLYYSLKLRTTKHQNNVVRACLYWQTQSECYAKSKVEYDYVIAYAQGIPTFYVAEKTNARKKKLAWINATYTPEADREYIEKKYVYFDTVVGVSEVISETEAAHFPSIKNKTRTYLDLINPNTIQKLSRGHIDICRNPQELTLVTVGRVNPHKGYDIAVEAARILKEREVNYKWYFVGTGSLFEEIKRQISIYGLEDNVVLLGLQLNPYPYFRLADIYVQPSRYEGFGLTIAEARLLNIPVVCTRFNTVFMQMIDGKNGLVSEMNGESLADKILELWQDKDLYNSIKNYLQQEKKGNLELIDDFYNLLK